MRGNPVKISLEANEEIRTVYEHFGRKRRVCDVKLGTLEVTAPTKESAAAAMRAALLARALSPRPMVRVLRDGRIAVARLDGATLDGVLGWSVDVYSADGRRGGCGMGADLRGADLSSDASVVEAALRSAFDHYVESINEALG